MAQLDLFGFGKEPEASPKKKSKEHASSKEKSNGVEQGVDEKDLFIGTNKVDETDLVTIDEALTPAVEITSTDGNEINNTIGESESLDQLTEVASDDNIVAADEAINDSELATAEIDLADDVASEVEESYSDSIDRVESTIDEEVTEIPEVTLPLEDETTFAKNNGVTPLEKKENTNPVVFTDGKIGVKFKVKQLKEVAPKPEVKEIEEKVIIIKKLPQKRGRKSFKEIDAEVDLIEIPEDEILFQKQYYSISTVAGWFKVNTSLLRFWENEFDILKPRKNRKGDRMFRPEDVKNLQLIYHLLRERKYTIDGAKDLLKNNKQKVDIQLQLTQTLQKFKSFLLELKSNLQ